MARGTFKGGAYDFIEKPLTRKVLISTIDSILSRHDRLDSLAGKKLTAAEERILHLILNGKSNKEVAYILKRSVRTVEVHRSHIMAKLDVDNVVDLTKRAIQMGLAGSVRLYRHGYASA